MQVKPSEPRSADENLWRVEAARYALLRRLAYAMRHHLVVNLQPIGMITEVMDRRLKGAAPDLAQAQDSLGRINGLSKAAVQSCLDVVSWLAPDPAVDVTLQEGVADCLSLVRSNLSFRGFTVSEELVDAHLPVGLAALRTVLPAVLLTLTDNATGPARVLLRGRGSADGARLTVAIEASDGAPGFSGDAPYRMLGWDEVAALAAAEGTRIGRDGERVQLDFPVAG